MNGDDDHENHSPHGLLSCILRDDEQYDDHINCVGSPEELAEQAHILDILYAGTKVLNNGAMNVVNIGWISRRKIPIPIVAYIQAISWKYSKK